MTTTWTCLVVDDSDVVRRVMRTILEGIGLIVDEVATTEDAMARCRTKVPDAIVLDWHIPGSNPLEFVTALRANPLGRRIKMLYVMTNNDPADVAKARAAGVNEIMTKPFHRVQLEAKILGLLSPPRDAAVDFEAHRPLLRAGSPASLHAFRTVLEA